MGDAVESEQDVEIAGEQVRQSLVYGHDIPAGEGESNPVRMAVNGPLKLRDVQRDDRFRQSIRVRTGGPLL